MNKTKAQEKSVYRPVRLSADMDKAIESIATANHLSKSEVLRNLVTEGLAATGAQMNETHLYEVVKEAMQEVLKPSVERLASISAKATQIDAANFFMYIYALTRNGSEREQQEIQEAVEKARSLGIQYLKLRDRDLDSFIAGGAKQIADEN